jgi:hypothetical protein
MTISGVDEPQMLLATFRRTYSSMGKDTIDQQKDNVNTILFRDQEIFHAINSGGT